MSIKITFKVHTHLFIHKNLSRLYRDGNSIQDIDRLLRRKTVDIGSDKGLTPVRGHSTTWTNPDLMCKLAFGDATQEEWLQTSLLKGRLELMRGSPLYVFYFTSLKRQGACMRQ